jgi:hypothetical protein
MMPADVVTPKPGIRLAGQYRLSNTFTGSAWGRWVRRTLLCPPSVRLAPRAAGGRAGGCVEQTLVILACSHLAAAGVFPEYLRRLRKQRLKQHQLKREFRHRPPEFL